MKKFTVGIFVLLSLSVGLALGLRSSSALATSNNNLIDDGVFDSSGSMTASQIDAWLNTFPNSCISTNSGFTAPDPTGYSPDANFIDGHYSYGSPVSAGTVVYDLSQAYHINPRVLLTKLQNEEMLVDGSVPYGYSQGCNTWQFASAVGYACTDSGTYAHSYTYTGADPYSNTSALVTPLYYRNGVAQNSISSTCVNQNVKAGFSEQLDHAAWLLTFSRHKSEGDTGWAVVSGSWNHCEDNDTCAASYNIPADWSCYSGYMTQGTYKLCPYDTQAVYYDGSATIDGTGVHMDNGSTAALYVYTPHLQSFTSIYTNYFGAPYDVYTWSLQSQYAYTDSSKATPVDLTNLLVGQKVYVGFTATNTGDVTWSNSGSNPVHAGTTYPQDRTSAFCDTADTPAWLGCTRPANLTEASVAPGQTGTFEFWYQAPATAGTYNEHFSILSEGLKWMNDPGLYYHTVVKPPIYTWSLQSQYAYTDSSKATPVDLTKLTAGQKVFIGFTAKNTGNIAWTNSGTNPVRAGASSPTDRSSAFCDTSWLSCSRPTALKEASVATGSVGTFEFWYQVPATAGTYKEFFRPLAEGYSWMNDVGMNFYSVVHFDSSGGNTLTANQQLTSNQFITSANGNYRLIMQGDGNLVLYSINRPIWASNTVGKPVVKLVMQSDGNLVLYDAQDKAYWSSGTAGRGSSHLVMQDDGNLVAYSDSTGQAIWNSRTNGQF